MKQPLVPYPTAIRRFPKVRQSILSNFDLCALLTHFDLKYARGWYTHPQGRGQLFHRFASRALREMAMQGEPTIEVDVALAILVEVLRQADTDRQCPHCGSTKIRKGISKQGMRYCWTCRQRFESQIVAVPEAHIKDLYWVVKKWAHDNSFDVHNIVDVEERLEAHARYPNPHGGSVERTLTGQMDVVLIEGNDHAIVIDWKDSWKLPPQTEVSGEGYFQQRFYAWLIFQQRGAPYKDVEKVTLREFYVRRSEPREAVLYRERHADDLDQQFAALIERFDRAVERNEWQPSPGAHCTYACPMPHRCPIHPEARGAGRITSPEEAARVAAELVVAEAIVKQQKQQLGPWVEMHGAQPVRDAKGRRMIGYVEEPRITRPTLDQIEQLEAELGRAPTTAEIKGLYKEGKSTKLRAFTPKPVEDTTVEEAEEDAAMLEKLKQAVEERGEAA